MNRKEIGTLPKHDICGECGVYKRLPCCIQCNDCGVTLSKDDGMEEAVVCTACKGFYKSHIIQDGVHWVFDQSAPRDLNGKRNSAHGILYTDFLNGKTPPVYQQA